MKRRMTLLLTVLFVLAGCSSKEEFLPDTFSKQDLAIYKVDAEKERVSYGMSRKQAEKVLGSGDGGENYVNYDNIVNVYYRDGKVVSIQLNENSEGTYRSARGAEVGMSLQQFKELYGDQYGVELSAKPRTLDFYYDPEAGKFLNKEEIKSLANKGEDTKNIYGMMVFIENDLIRNLMVHDAAFAFTMK